jgi:hypothetical protein
LSPLWAGVLMKLPPKTLMSEELQLKL